MNPMKEEVSVYLDAVRFAAALLVFFSHFALKHISGGFIWQINAYGHEAVTVFFVLSGFVIAYATDTRERTPGAYAVSRAARMYSVAVPAVLLTVVLDQIGSHLRPDLYTAAWGYHEDLDFLRFFSALTYTNEIWWLHVGQGSNAAYWSMGYEVPYYLVFGLALYAPPRWRKAAVALALLALGPAIVVSLPIWLLGVATYRYLKQNTVSPRQGLQLFCGSMLLWLAYQCVTWVLGRPMVEGDNLFRRHEVLQDYFIAAFFVLNLIGFSAAATRLGPPLMRYRRQVRWLAGATFTLYLCHLPIAQFLVACMPWPAADWRSRVLVFSGTLVAVFVLAEFTEKRKQGWRRAFEALGRTLSRQPRQAPR